MSKYLKGWTSSVLTFMGLWMFTVGAAEFDQSVRFWVLLTGSVIALAGLEWKIRIIARETKR